MGSKDKSLTFNINEKAQEVTDLIKGEASSLISSWI